jgi:hypothetical protein
MTLSEGVSRWVPQEAEQAMATLRLTTASIGGQEQLRGQGWPPGLFCSLKPLRRPSDEGPLGGIFQQERKEPLLRKVL